MSDHSPVVVLASTTGPYGTLRQELHLEWPAQGFDTHQSAGEILSQTLRLRRQALAGGARSEVAGKRWRDLKDILDQVGVNTPGLRSGWSWRAGKG